VFYVEGFFTIDRDRDVIIGVQAALSVLVDDAPMLVKDLREWGIWQRFGVAVHLSAGRDLVLARGLHASPAIRGLGPGRPTRPAAPRRPRPRPRCAPLPPSCRPPSLPIRTRSTR